MSVKTTFRGGGGWEDHPDKYVHQYPRVATTDTGQVRMQFASSKDAQPYWTKERNQAMDKEYNTDPRSPLHTNNRFPD